MPIARVARSFGLILGHFLGPILGQKNAMTYTNHPPKYQPNRSTDGQDDTTFEGNLRQPKLKGQSLVTKEG